MVLDSSEPLQKQDESSPVAEGESILCCPKDKDKTTHRQSQHPRPRASLDARRRVGDTKAPPERPLATAERECPPPAPTPSASAAPPPGAPGSLSVSHSVRHRRQLSERSRHQLKQRHRNCHPQDKPWALGQKAKPGSSVPLSARSLQWTRRLRVPSDPLRSHLAGCARTWVAAREEPGREEAAARSEGVQPGLGSKPRALRWEAAAGAAGASPLRRFAGGTASPGRGCLAGFSACSRARSPRTMCPVAF